MTLTLRSLSKNGKNAMYTGAAAVLRLPLAAFPDKQAPTAFVVDDVFAPARTPKVKLTKEERAALRASQPKPTEAERIAKAEARIAARKAKLAALEGQPAL